MFIRLRHMAIAAALACGFCGGVLAQQAPAIEGAAPSAQDASPTPSDRAAIPQSVSIFLLPGMTDSLQTLQALFKPETIKTNGPYTLFRFNITSAESAPVLAAKEKTALARFAQGWAVAKGDTIIMIKLDTSPIRSNETKGPDMVLRYVQTSKALEALLTPPTKQTHFNFFLNTYPEPYPCLYNNLASYLKQPPIENIGKCELQSHWENNEESGTDTYFTAFAKSQTEVVFSYYRFTVAPYTEAGGYGPLWETSFGW